ncbi:hypothetical protein HYH02_013269 [Chlamydomonas schloesseri]|uniref:SnoaL-like domain-containing protein n=1 Tax=Chlamydomonas schloesseri TaxID=2026947 RepID=A0A835SQY2_9CHLO|nr:hypothetical protein HYH02_013269 [Chlamydomonas schloesseri]|eukprot:KAG2431692.1 hypothetical protein HYH02_013269 [Chlamydomonas schloesseri]
MVTHCHSYYDAVWSRGELSHCDQLLEPTFVHRDMCSPAAWAGGSAASLHGATETATGITVGPRAFKALVTELRTMYPDYFIRVEEVAVCDTHKVYVSWVSCGTQLEGAAPAAAAAAAVVAPSSWLGGSGGGRGSPPVTAASALSGLSGGGAASAASYHNNLVRGVDIISFNVDRTRIKEVNVFRQLTTDERREVERRLAPTAPLEIRLARLHWDTQPQPAAGEAGRQQQGGSSSSKAPRAQRGNSQQKPRGWGLS